MICKDGPFNIVNFSICVFLFNFYSINLLYPHNHNIMLFLMSLFYFVLVTSVALVSPLLMAILFNVLYIITLLSLRARLNFFVSLFYFYVFFSCIYRYAFFADVCNITALIHFLHGLLYSIIFYKSHSFLDTFRHSCVDYRIFLQLISLSLCLRLRAMI